MTLKRIGVVFPGYGQQFIGMGKDLYDELRIVQEFFEQAASTAELNFVKLMFASSDDDISSIRNSYVAIYLFEAALYQVLFDKGLRPDFVAGYGIGEYAAGYASGSLSFVDGLYILNKYAQFYDDFLKDKDYTVLRIIREFEVESIEELCEKKSTVHDVAVVSSQNTQNAFYVAGSEKVIEKIQEYCIKEVIRKVRIIGSGYGMHSHLVDPVVEQLKFYYHKIQFKDLKVPVITNVDGVYVTTGIAFESAIQRKINHRIQWFEVMKGFEGCDVIISVGPGDQLIEWFKEVYPDKEYHQVTSINDIDKIAHLFQSNVLADGDTMGQSITDEQAELLNPDVDANKNLYDADQVNELPTDFDVDDE
ncbi:MAG: ACP S-malonyltransferase [Acinetobacter sp.]|nr:ACP S-malonyltransferase [Acinetobacter sp.]